MSEADRLARRVRYLTRRMGTHHLESIERAGLMRRLADEYGWTQAELARLIGVSQQAVSRMVKP